MNLLALDTATEACSAALSTRAGTHERWARAPRDHARLLMPMIDALLTEQGLELSDLDALAFGRGPGSFTGLRIATGVVQGLALSLDKPVAPVSVLAALALQAFRRTPSDRVCTALDARMDEVYWAVFSRGHDDYPVPEIAETVCAPEAVTLPEGASHWASVGSGWSAYGDRLERACGRPSSLHVNDALPHAQDIATLALSALERGEALTAEKVEPVYLRDRVAQKPHK